MHDCEKPRFLLDADVVWVGNEQSDTTRSEFAPPFTIGEVAEKFDMTLRALRFYESRGLLSPTRQGRTRHYDQADCERIALILKGKKLGFTLAEIKHMVAAQDGRGNARALSLSSERCLEQIEHFEQKMREAGEAIAELREIESILSARMAGGEAGQSPEQPR